MSVYVRVRNGMMVDGEGNGGVTEGDLRGAISDIIEQEGVVDLEGGHLLVHEAGSPDMEIVVDAGVGYIPNDSYDDTDSDSIKFWEAVVAGITGERTLAISSNSSGQLRIDLVCLKIDPGAEPDYYASDVAELIIVEGTPGAGAPAVPAYHLKLAEVSVANGETAIENEHITDSRVQVQIKEKFQTVQTDNAIKLENKRIKKRITSITSSATPTPNFDTMDQLNITALAEAAELQNPDGTPDDGDVMIIRIKDNGTARALTYDTQYRAVGTILPSTTILGKTLYLAGKWNAAATKLDILAVQQEY